MQRIGRSALVVVALGVALALPQGAAAHSLVVASDPAAGATLASAPTVVRLTFGEAPDLKLTTVKVLDAGGQDQTSGPIQGVTGDATQLRVPLKPLPDGIYTVAWRSVSAVDGHVAAGSFAFGVGVTPASPAPGSAGNGTTSPGASAASVLARWVLYLGLIALFGAAFLGFAVEPRPPRSLVGLAGVGWAAAAVGTLAVIGLQWSDSQVDLGTLIGSSVGFGALERLGMTAVAGVSVAIIALGAQTRRWQFGLAAAASAAWMLVDVLNGHAAAGSSGILQVGVQWLHILGVGIWIGGLAALLLAVRGLPSSEKAKAVRIFSTWAGLGLAAVAGTGILRALSAVGTFEALFGTGFGLIVIFKSLGLGALALLGATNRFFNVPAAARSLRGLRRVGSVELALGATLLAATGLLANLAPPSASAGTQATPPAGPVLAMGSDFGTSVRLRLAVDPGAPGVNQFTARVTDFDTGAAAKATGISLRFQLASRSGVGASTLDLGAGSGGSFSASGSNLSLDGIWTITATVALPSGSVEVPLVVATRLAPQPTDTIATPGAPTIYTVHLAKNLSVQVYLDPGKAGRNELHLTFFDAAGTELPVPTATVAVSPPDGPAFIMAGRQLEPGHFVVDLSTKAGTMGVDLVGPAPSGEQLHAHLQIEVQP